MAEVFRLPKMGQTMSEATIVRWLKPEGEKVEGWEAVVVMLTDKADMEVEPMISGTLRKILAPEGAVIPVGGALAIIGAPEEDITELLAAARNGGAPAVAGEPAPGQPGGRTAGPVPAEDQPAATSSGAPLDELPSVSPRARETAAEGGVDWKGLSLVGTGFEGMVVERDVQAFLQQRAREPREEPVRATPLAAKIAAGMGLPLGGVPGSGPGGRVQADDVRRAAARREVPAIQAREIPLQGMRRVIADRLSGSYQRAVHVPLRVDVDMSAAAELRRQLKPVLEPSGVRLTYTDLIAAAVVQALLAQPLLNATLEENLVRVHPAVHLGIAVALEEGLTVPVIHGAQALRLPELSAAIQEAARGARAGVLPPAAYGGGTFTVTNLGQFGVDSFDPIINPPQAAILGVGRIQDRVVAVGGAPAVRPMMTLTVTFDHRALDGAPASLFLARVKELLECPARLLL